MALGRARARRLLPDVALVLLAIVTGVLVVSALRSNSPPPVAVSPAAMSPTTPFPSSEPPSASSRPAPPPTSPSRSTPRSVVPPASGAAFTLGVSPVDAEQPAVGTATLTVSAIGDSLLGQTVAPGASYPGFVSHAAASLRWQLQVHGAAGGGYVADRAGSGTYADRVARVVAERPAVVVLVGSVNDAGQPGLRVAVADVLARVKAGLPAAKIVVIGPLARIPASAEVLAVRNTLRMEAGRVRAVFVDPIGEAWLSRADQLLDAVHPTVARQRELGELLVADLRRARIVG